MKIQAAPSKTWEVRMNWGDRNLEAEVIDGALRRQLTLGDRPEDDLVIADGRLELTWHDGQLEVVFSTGVTGTATIRGDEPVSLGQLVERGRVEESGGRYRLRLGDGDALTLKVGLPTIEVRQAKARVTRVSPDTLALAALVGALGLLAAWLVVTIKGMTPLNLLGN